MSQRLALGSVLHVLVGEEVLAEIPARFSRKENRGIKIKDQRGYYINESIKESCHVGEKMYVAGDDEKKEQYISDLKKEIDDGIFESINRRCNPENLDKGARLIMEGMLGEEFIIPEGDYVLIGYDNDSSNNGKQGCDRLLGVFSKLSDGKFDKNGIRIFFKCTIIENMQAAPVALFDFPEKFLVKEKSKPLVVPIIPIATLKEFRL